MLGMEDTHKAGYVAVIIIAFVTGILQTLVTCLSLAASPTQKLIFSNSSATVLNIYVDDLNPQPWAHYVLWGVTLTWQLIWLCYGISTICRYTSYGYLYIAPGHMHSSIYLGMILGSIFSIIWLFLVDKGYIQYALIFILAASISSFVSLIISLRRLYKRGPVLRREDANEEIWLVRIFVQNGLALFSTWSVYLAMVNVGVILYHYDLLAAHTITIILVACLLALIVGLTSLDIFVGDVYTRYLFGGYIVILVAITGTFLKMSTQGSGVWTLTAIVVAMAAVACVLKTSVTIYRHVYVPIWTGSSFFISGKNYGSIDLYKEASGTDRGNEFLH